MRHGKMVSCLICRKFFYRYPSRSTAHCSAVCANKTKQGRPLRHSGQFKKGHTAWNKGIPASDFVKEVARTTNLNNTHRRGAKLSESTRALISQGRKGKATGKDHPRWKEDRTEVDLNKQRYRRKEIKEWRTAVFTRDNYKCMVSDENCCAYLEAHHILSWREYPDLRFNINNGITLCRVHHPRKRTEEKRLSVFFQNLVSVSN